MRSAKVFAVLALLGLAASVSAQDYVTVERRRSPAGVILRDTVTGGLLGSAIAGGVILYNMGIEDKENYDWGRTLAWGAGIGLGAGLVLGLVDVATGYSAVSRLPVQDGLSRSRIGARDQSGTQVFPLVLKGF